MLLLRELVRANQSQLAKVSLMTLKKILQDASPTMWFQLPSTVLTDSALNQTIAVVLDAVRPHDVLDVLTQALSPLGYNWSMQNGTLCMLKALGSCCRARRFS